MNSTRPYDDAVALPTLRPSRAARRDLREMRRRLVTELATYDTPSARTDLYAALGRHTDSETAYLRSLL